MSMSTPLEDRYRAVVDELAKARTTLALARAHHRRARVDGFQSSLATAVSAREHDADAHAIDAACAELDAELRVQLLEDEHLYVRDMMKLRR